MPFYQISIPLQQLYAIQCACSAGQYALSADACRSVCPFSRRMHIGTPFQQMHVDQHAFFAPLPLWSLHENVPHVAECPAVCGGVRQGDAADGVAYAPAWSDPAHCGTGREHVRVYY